MNESGKATGGRLTSGSRLCEDLDVRLPYLKQHGGGCMAYSTLAEDVEAFVVPDLGYVAYARQRLLGERVFVLADPIDRKSTRLNSSHLGISYAVFCLKN